MMRRPQNDAAFPALVTKATGIEKWEDLSLYDFARFFVLTPNGAY